MPLTLGTPEELTASLDELTTRTLDGNGVFDAMMAAVRVQLDNEYASGRIRGPEYARVFSETITAAMQVGVQYAVSRAKAVHEIRLLEQQLVNMQVDKLVREAELANLTTQNALLEQQVLREGQQVVLLTEQVLTQQQQTALVAAQVATQEDELLSAAKNRERADAEIALLAQKQATELAQVDGTGVDPDSVLGKQIILYGNQAASFIRDAEQKAAEILTKTWSVAAANGDGDADLSKENRLRKEYLGEAIKVLLTGIGSNVATIDASVPVVP